MPNPTEGLGRYLWPRLVIVLVVVAVTLGGLTIQQVRLIQVNRDEVLVTRALDLRHRIKQEDCVIRVLNEVIDKRINSRSSEPITLCASEEELDHLRVVLRNLEADLVHRGVAVP
ncbi:MAG: hypothetical protein M3404_05090 [Actinomycetota bacterium]|nr:hypothetical protein [Actinomycetota bacterium]